MTKIQTGQFEVGTYGYPVQVLLSSPPDPVVKLTDVSAIQLTLTKPDLTTVSRSILSGYVDSGDPNVSDTIQWTVLAGEHDQAGRYAFVLEIDSEGGTKHLVTSGTYFVSALADNTIGPETDLQLTGYLYTYNGAGVIKPGVALTFQLTAMPTGSTGESPSTSPFTVTSNATTGFLSAGFRKGATYSGRRGREGASATFTVPNTPDVNGGFALPDILGK